MNITIRTIPHAEQRYPTAGDWWFDDAGDLQIRVSAMGNWRYETLVARHELDEALLCKAHGIPQESVDAFDAGWAIAEWALGEPNVDEPGLNPAAPYHVEHMTAYAAELAFMVNLGVAFNEYTEALARLFGER